MNITTRLREAIGDERVVTSREDCSFFSEDLFSPHGTMDITAVLMPNSAAQVGDIVRIANTEGIAIVARGGGMSYTGGYRPTSRPVLVLDLRGLCRIREINSGDRYMVVDTGVTWEQIHEALSGSKLRPALRGPISGSVSTVGGAVSQNLPGSMDGVLGLEIVDARGAAFWTGSAGAAGRTAFYRNFGPDLTGLFLGDAGTLGIKTAAALRLETIPDGIAHASFAFDSMADAAAAMGEISALGLGGRVFGLDPLKNKTATKVGIREGLATLAKVVSADGIAKGLANAARIVSAGQNAYDDVKWSVHLSFEGATQRVADELLAKAVAICKARGRSIEPSIPIAMRARPFSVRGFLGLKGERWAPMHGIFPLSEVANLVPALESFFANRAAQLEKLEIVHSYMLSANSGFFLVEPMFYWPDRLLPLHRSNLSERQLAKLQSFDDNPRARDFVAKTRAELQELFASHGAVSAQLGRFYPYRETLRAPTLGVFDELKAALDPNGIFNPGALGTGKKL